MKIAKLVVIIMLTVLGAFTLSDSTGCAQSGAPAAPKAESKQAASVPRNLAIFIFDGVQIIDYTGPYEVFGQAHDGENHLFNVYIVSQRAEPITTAMGMTVVPKYTFENMPKADVLVLPGGGVRPHLDDPKVIKWVQEIALNLEYNWQPDVNYARASFADLHLRRVLGRDGFTLPEGTGWKILGQ